MSRKIGVPAAVLAVLAAAGFLAASRAVRRPGANPLVQVKPFVMGQFHISYARRAEGEIIESRTKLRRADGSLAIVGLFPPEPKLRVTRKVEWLDGRGSGVAGFIRGRFRGAGLKAESEVRTERLKNPGPGCASQGETTEGEETVMGQQAYKVVRKEGQTQRVTEWRLAAFECEPAQMVIEQITGGEWKKVSEAKLVFFRPARPDPAVFDDWAVYGKLGPVEVKRRILERSGIKQTDCPECYAALP